MLLGAKRILSYLMRNRRLLEFILWAVMWVYAQKRKQKRQHSRRHHMRHKLEQGMRLPADPTGALKSGHR